MTSVEQAVELRDRITKAISALKRYDDFRERATEGEVRGRYEAIEMTLLVFQNDIITMVDEWKRSEKFEGGEL